MCCSAPTPPSPPGMAAGGVNSMVDQASKYGYNAADSDLAYRTGVNQDNQGRIQDLYSLATQAAQQQLGIGKTNQQLGDSQLQQYNQQFAPTASAMNMDAYQGQYLSPDELADLKANPDKGQQYGKLAADRKAQEDEGGLAGLRDQGISYLQGRQSQDAEAMQGQINSSYDSQARNLSRFGGDPNRMMAYASQIANQQSLARVTGLNQLSQGYGQQIQGLKDTYGQQIQQTQANRYNQGTQLRQQAAGYGQNLANSSGQAYGLATQAGNAAVANQNVGLTAPLSYAQFQTGGYQDQLGAAGIASQGALGLGQLENQGYGAYTNAWGQSQQGKGAMLGGLMGVGGTLGAAKILSLG